MSYQKTIVATLLLAFAFSGAMAQNKNVRKAKRAFQKGDLKEAKSLITPATTNEKTVDDAETWYVMGNVYYALSQKDSVNQTGQTYRDSAFLAYKKCLDIDDKYSPMVLKSYMPFVKLYKKYWGYGVYGFNNDKYKAAFQGFKKVKEMVDYSQTLDLNVLPSDIDTMVYLNMGNAAYRAGMKDSAVHYYQKVVDMGYDEEAFVYKILLQEYRNQENDDKFFAVLKKGRELFPKDKDFVQMEINYYKMNGEIDKLIEKLKKAVQNNPNDYAKVFNLAHAYDNMANKQEDSTEEGAAKHDKLFDNAMKYYQKAIELKPDSYGANFNLGLLYYNSAAHIGAKMNNLTDEETDSGMYDSLAKEEDTYLKKALPFLQKAYQILDAMPSLTSNQMAAYKNTISGLKGIYARQDKMDKYDELEKKLKNADSKLEK